MTSAAPASVHTPVPIIEAEVVIEDERWRRRGNGTASADVRRALAALAALAPAGFPQSSQVTIVLADDARVAALNANFRRKTGPTNVLSFPAGADATEPGEPPYLGDVIIARETLAREAAELAIPVEHHLQHLAIHGVLHLVGYDHIADADARVMEALETRALSALGIADPYLPQTEPPSP